MNMPIRYVIAALMLALIIAPVMATEPGEYVPATVVYDVSSADPSRFMQILDRVSLLQTIYGSDPFTASIVIVIHEGAIPLLAKGTRKHHPNLANRARDLAMGEVIQFRLCQASATMQGYGHDDFEGFIKLVPMADAEIVRLQYDGYAYLH